MEFAQQVRKLRIERGLNQSELAQAIFVSRQTVSNWENDKTYPDLQSLVLLSQLFGISIDELIQGDAAVMKRAMEADSRKMRWLSTGMILFLLLAIVFSIGLSAAWQDRLEPSDLTKGNVAGAITFLPLYAMSMTCAFWIERIKARNNLVAYREIMAFANGNVDVTLEGHAFARNHPAISAFVKFAFAAVFGAVFGLLIYKIIN